MGSALSPNSRVPLDLLVSKIAADAAAQPRPQSKMHHDDRGGASGARFLADFESMEVLGRG